jgi:hypothetical protein
MVVVMARWSAGARRSSSSGMRIWLPGHLAKTANRLDARLGGYDLATSEQEWTRELCADPLKK